MSCVEQLEQSCNRQALQEVQNEAPGYENSPYGQGVQDAELPAE